MSRTNIFASLRFLMIFYIVQGHFLQVATNNVLVLSFFKQHNAVVGCFFLLSGFLPTYNAPIGQTHIPWWPFFKKRLVRIYPVYALVTLLFLPMFLAVDFHYGTTLLLEIKRALVAGLLLHAWHPDWGLLWNSPTWFLSSLVFCFACFPWLMAQLNQMSKMKLGIVLVVVFLSLVALKLFYSAQNGVFFLEGLVEPKPIPYFNFIRFFPPINLLEFILGMTVGLLARGGNARYAYAPALTILVLVAVLFVRTLVPINDMLARTLIFTPLFLLFLYTVSFNNAKYLGIFEAKPWVFLGEISFSLYCLHGAIGQLFYKKAVKAMLTMPSVPYATYLAVVFVAAVLCHYGVERRIGILVAQKRGGPRFQNAS